MKLRLPNWFKLWLPLAAASTILAGLVYVAVHQNYRQSANDPQIQMARDAADALETGQSPAAIVGTDKIAMDHSLAPFLIIYDDNRQVLASGAHLSSETPAPPEGSFQFAKDYGQNRFTWEPENRPYTREATVLVHNTGKHPGYVLAARSLYEVEQREAMLTWETAAALVVLLVGTAVFAWLLERLTKPR